MENKGLITGIALAQTLAMAHTPMNMQDTAPQRRQAVKKDAKTVVRRKKNKAARKSRARNKK